MFDFSLDELDPRERCQPSSHLTVLSGCFINDGVILFWEQEAIRNKCHASSNKCLTSSNKKLLETSATLVVTGALLVVTRSY